MSIRYLESLMAPASMAVVGASSRVGSLGQRVWAQVRASAYQGKVWPVNPHHSVLDGVEVCPKVSRLPQAPDLALVCTPAATVADVVADLGALGCRAVVLHTPDLGVAQMRAVLVAARVHTLRILGPGRVTLLSPHIGLDAGGAGVPVAPGSLALVSQSDAPMPGLLDWASARGLGFSHVLSLGAEADIDVADMLDFLGGDARTRAVLLYVEQVDHSRKLLSAARAASRNKPVIVVKSGWSAVGRALVQAQRHGGAVGSDAVLDAAIARAGMLRVDSFQELFLAAETLSRQRDGPTEHLAVLTNCVSAAVMAADAADTHGVPLSPDAPNGHPVCLPPDAAPAQWVQALEALLALPRCAVLVVHAPTPQVDSVELARALAMVASGPSHRVLSCWQGAGKAEGARQAWRGAGLVAFDSPEEAVRAFALLRTHHLHQQELMQTPPACCASTVPVDKAGLRTLVDAALAAGREWLAPTEAMDFLQAAGLPVVPTRRVLPDIGEAQTAAALLGYPVALKVASSQVVRKSVVGGVRLNIGSAHELAGAVRAVLACMQTHCPEAEVEGLVVQRMVPATHAHELQVSTFVDPVFGPMLAVGHGGTAADVLADRALALPPLNSALAQAVVQRTRVSRLLTGYGAHPPADQAALTGVLLAVSQLLAEVPELAELDINPLLLGPGGAVVLDARVRLSGTCPAGAPHFAIKPYPQELVEEQDWHGQSIVLRPIRAEDEEQHLAFLRQMDPEDIRMRVFYRRRSIAHSELARLTQIDYSREMAFVATRPLPEGGEETLGVVRATTDPDNQSAEFGVLVRSDLKGGGLGRRLMRKLIAHLRARGTQQLVGTVLTENTGMLGLVRSLGFVDQDHPENPSDTDVRHIVLHLQAAASEATRTTRTARSGHAGGPSTPTSGRFHPIFSQETPAS